MNPTDPDDVVEGTPNRKRLDFIKPRETLRLLSARRKGYTKFVSYLRVILPSLTFLVLVSLVVWPYVSPERITKAVLDKIPDVVIDHLHFTGLDQQNQPYSLTALKATRPSGATNIYDLEKPEGEITLKNGTWLAGRANLGRYDQTTSKLWLGGDVQLFHDKGYQCRTDEAQIDIRENYAWGVKPVLIQGNFGEIRGQGFRVLNDGTTMIVNGPAKAIIGLASKAENKDQPKAHPPIP